MFDLSQLRVDRLSFWLGFLTASLLWWLLGRVRPLFPIWLERFRQYRNLIQQKNLSSVEVHLRRQTVQHAQQQHLASPLFSLDETIIQPWLLVPPPELDPGTQPQPQSIASQIIPYLPDSPEIVAPFGINRMTPAQAAQIGRNIAIIGQPGTGKSTALNHLACQIARQDESIGKLAQAVPILIHILDLNVSLAEGADPIDHVIQGSAKHASRFLQQKLSRFLQATLRDKGRRVVLLLDGLDEIPPEKLTETTIFLSALHRKHPRLQIIVTASADFLDGLTRAGFYPLGIAAWSQAERSIFLHKWSELWQSRLAPEIKNASGFLDVDPVLSNYWLESETDFVTPLEWTLRLWGAHAGDLSGSRSMSILDSYVTRFLPEPGDIVRLEELAQEMVQQSSPSLSFSEMEKILSRSPAKQSAGQASIKPSSPPGTNSDVPAPIGANRIRKKTSRSLVSSRGEQIIAGLIKGGVLIEHSSGQIRFSSPVLLGFLAGPRISAEVATRLSRQMDWVIASQALQYSAARNDENGWIFSLIENPDAPLYRNLLTAARWLRDAPVQASWRSMIMRNLVSLLQKDHLPLSIQTRLINAFYLSRDPSAPRLLRQLLVSHSPTIRRAALLGCGALGSPPLINNVLELLMDRDPNVRQTACLALAAIPGETAINAMVELLLSGDEDLRRASAEALAQNRVEGHKVLEEAATVDDLLVRRAAMFGLVQVGEPWAQKILEKTALGDGDWVVRNAAAQALETLQQTNPTSPRPLPPPSESPWLLAFASKLGKGILPGQPATDLLQTVLKSGSVEEQIAALRYLRNRPDESVLRDIYELLSGTEEAVRESAIYALWWIATSGSRLTASQESGGNKPQ